jgi:hypothetical protein
MGTQTAIASLSASAIFEPNHRERRETVEKVEHRSAFDLSKRV